VVNIFKRISVVKDLVLHKLDAIAVNLENQSDQSKVIAVNLESQTALQQQSSELLSNKLEKLIQDQQESIRTMLLAQSLGLHTEMKALLQSELNGKLKEFIHQPKVTSPNLKILQTAEDFLIADKFSEAQKLYEYVLLSDPNNQSLIDKIEFIKNIKAIHLEWNDPSYVSPNKAYFPTIPPLNIELSSHCNLKCPYCANATLDRDYVKMQDTIIDRIIEQGKLLNLQVFGVHGVGEPLLRKDLEVILSKFREEGIWQGSLVSNCTLLTLDRMKSLRQAGVVYIYCSVDTLDADLYRRTRTGDVEKTLGNIKLAASHFPDVHFTVGLMNHKEQIVTPEIEQQFYEKFAGLPNVKMIAFENGRFPGAEEDWRKEEFLGGGDTCTASSNYLTIDANGKVALCCADQNTEHILGDIHLQTLSEIWYSRQNQETFRNIALGVHGCPDVCFKCILKPTSKGIESIEPILYSPMSNLIDQAEDFFKQANFQESLRLYDHALTRDPYNTKIKAKVNELCSITGTKSLNYFQDFNDMAQS
jgi:radical SAM protein with 4Fe4S-binding SPASM domain